MGAESLDSSDSSTSFQHVREELQLEIAKARLEVKAAQLRLRALELGRQLKERRKQRILGDRVQSAYPVPEQDTGELRQSTGRKSLLCGQRGSLPTVTLGKSATSGTVGKVASSSTLFEVEDSRTPLSCSAVQESGKVETGQSFSEFRSGFKQRLSPPVNPGGDAQPAGVALERSQDSATLPGGPAAAERKIDEVNFEALPGQDTTISPVHREWPVVLRGMPSWMLSGLVHAVILLVMALCLIPLRVNSHQVFITGESEFSQSENLEKVEFETERFEEMVPVKVESMSAAETGISGPVDSAGLAVPVLPGELGLSAIDSIAALVGNKLDASGEGTGQVGTGRGGAQFFDSQAMGSRFAFVVDRSKSMRGGSKWEAALDELHVAISRMDSTQSFFVVFFSGEPTPMFGHEHPERRPLQATEKNVVCLESWLHTIEPAEKRQAQHVDRALDYVIAMRPDATFLLTDGEIAKSTETYLKEANRVNYDPIVGESRPTAIHTIGFSKEGAKTLQRIAADHGGTYVFHAPSGS
ncbi:MAG: hypothetical protein CMJ81_08050 [Planctomycetaceae bacterium]|nr:hypothetical protein [Planctomycetaceae bacterium]MBP62344.1 hypothetical protein [Planctomycetaceae bacterium]